MIMTAVHASMKNSYSMFVFGIGALYLMLTEIHESVKAYKNG